MPDNTNTGAADSLIEAGKAFREYDQINPNHYRTNSAFNGPDGAPFQAIHVIELFDLDYHSGNAVKYILRCGKKPGATAIKDLEKAKWYIERKIKELEKLEDMLISQK